MCNPDLRPVCDLELNFDCAYESTLLAWITPVARIHRLCQVFDCEKHSVKVTDGSWVRTTHLTISYGLVAVILFCALPELRHLYLKI